MALGFYQGIVLGQGGPTLNINNTFCCFYQNYNLVEFLSCYLNRDIRKHGKSVMKIYIICIWEKHIKMLESHGMRKISVDSVINT
jgi:hypothetical protein